MDADFTPDAFAIRTTDRAGRSRGGFEWPRELGAMVSAPDWLPTHDCGNGLHGLADGCGDYSLLRDDADAIWWVVGFIRAESITLGGDKVKFPRCRVEYFGGMGGALTRISQEWIRLAIAAGGQAHADSGHASAAGDSGHASAAGERGHASAAGGRGHAEVTGKNSVAAALGWYGAAKAGEAGAIMLAAYNDDGDLVAVRAAMVGQDGIEPNTWYRLSVTGEFEKVEA